jgi:outer membrane protein OmpA-like peptidoglycan-associated protein
MLLHEGELRHAKKFDIDSITPLQQCSQDPSLSSWVWRWSPRCHWLPARRQKKRTVKAEPRALACRTRVLRSLIRTWPTTKEGSDGGNISGLSTIFFEYDQARLTDTSKGKLKENADWIRANPAVTVQIEGHTDSRGSTEYNLSLGERRAKSVRQYLEGLGVESKRMTILSYGEEKPLASR